MPALQQLLLILVLIFSISLRTSHRLFCLSHSRKPGGVRPTNFPILPLFFMCSRWANRPGQNAAGFGPIPTGPAQCPKCHCYGEAKSRLENAQSRRCEFGSGWKSSGGSRSVPRWQALIALVVCASSGPVHAEPQGKPPPLLGTPPGTRNPSPTEQSAADSTPIHPGPPPVEPPPSTQVMANQEVTVHGRSPAEERRTSPHAISTVDLRQSRRESSDLAQVLGRIAGIGVQRAGALGSRVNVTMAGLSGEQIRFFLDGIPLEYTGFPFGVGNVPVNLVDRIDVYQGVVPIAFGADALGGAVNLVSRPGLRSTRGTASYQLGSFHTHRVTASAQGYAKKLGLTARLSGFLDLSQNNYPVKVDVFAPNGRISKDTVQRFHDGYFSSGGKLTVGIVDKPFATHLLGSVFFGTNQRQVQHDPSMGTPYGAVTFDKTTWGTNLTHAARLSDQTRIESTVGYSLVRSHFEDVSSCSYDWYGRCTARNVRGEIQQVPIDRSINDHVVFARAHLETELSAAHSWRISIAPTFAQRLGDDRELEGDEYDTLNHSQNVTALVLGAELTSTALRGTLKNVAFVKSYGQLARAEQRDATGEDILFQSHSFMIGGGDAVRLFLSERTYLKSSYEYAVRLPGADEYFGDGGQVIRNLELVPERSQNLNLGAYGDGIEIGQSRLQASALAFARFSDDLIYLSTPGFYLQYQNVRRARALGGEAQLGWSSPRDIFGLIGAVTYQDLRNRSKNGPQARFFGDRIPNRSPLTAHAEARLSITRLALPGDYLQLALRSQYTHGFFRTWESAGSPDQKARLPSQLSHSLALTYLFSLPKQMLSSSVELQNVTNQRLYDYYGVQRPGRSIFFKLTLDTH